VTVCGNERLGFVLHDNVYDLLKVNNGRCMDGFITGNDRETIFVSFD